MRDKRWSPTASEHFEDKSLSELQKRLKEGELFVEKHPEFRYGWHNEYMHELKRWIAEKIGRKTK